MRTYLFLILGFMTSASVQAGCAVGSVLVRHAVSRERSRDRVREHETTEPAPPETIERPRPVIEQVPPLPENPTEEQIAEHNARLEAAREKHTKELAAWKLEKQQIENRYANWLVEKNARESAAKAARESDKKKKLLGKPSARKVYVAWVVASVVVATGLAVLTCYAMSDWEWKTSKAQWQQK